METCVKKMLHKAVINLKHMTNLAQLTIIILIGSALGAGFYMAPESNNFQNTRLSNETLYPDSKTTSSTGNNNSEGGSSNQSGIGGGSIKGDCIAGKKALPIYNVDMASKNSEDTKKYVSLSFDAAWGADDTIQILDILDKYNVKVTFFMTGGWVENFPDIVKEIHKRGHDLGNHSQNHKQMSKLTAEEQKKEIMSVSQAIKNLTGYDAFLFRPPFGDYNATLIKTTYGCNHYPVQWSVDSLDWKDYGVDNIIKTVTKHKALKNGAIVLMHNGAKFTAQALENVITTLQSDGYTLVPISELIIRENFHMNTDGTQVAD